MVEARIKRFGLSIKAGSDFDLINPEDDPRYRSYVQSYIDVAGRHGVTPDAARTLVRTNATVIAALAVPRGEADAMICGVDGRYMSHLRHIREIIGFLPGVSDIRRWRCDHQQGRVFHRRYPGPAESERRGACGNGGAGGDPCAAVRYQARRSRSCRIPISAATIPTRRARCVAPPSCSLNDHPGNRGRRRDAGRYRAVGGGAATGAAALDARRRRPIS